MTERASPSRGICPSIHGRALVEDPRGALWRWGSPSGRKLFVGRLSWLCQCVAHDTVNSHTTPLDLFALLTAMQLTLLCFRQHSATLPIPVPPLSLSPYHERVSFCIIPIACPGVSSRTRQAPRGAIEAIISRSGASRKDRVAALELMPTA